MSIKSAKTSNLQTHILEKNTAPSYQTRAIVHDFNNLLTGLQMQLSTALLRLEPDSPARKDIEQALKTADYAAELIGELLNHPPKSKTSGFGVDLNQVIKEHVGMLQSLFKQYGITVVLDLCPNLPTAGISRLHISQVLMNLLINAVEAYEGSEGTIYIRTWLCEPFEKYERVKRPFSSRQIALEITDQAKGIENILLDHIFKPFFTTKPAGSGLGLTTCLNLVRAVGGTITVNSKPACGTTFTIFLPEAYPQSPFPTT